MGKTERINMSLVCFQHRYPQGLFECVNMTAWICLLVCLYFSSELLLYFDERKSIWCITRTVLHGALELQAVSYVPRCGSPQIVPPLVGNSELQTHVCILVPDRTDGPVLEQNHKQIPELLTGKSQVGSEIASSKESTVYLLFFWALSM